MRYLIYILFVICFLFSCGEYERLTIEKESHRYADSLFRVHKDSLTKLANAECTAQYDSYFNAAVDSIKQTQLVKIKKLIEK